MSMLMNNSQLISILTCVCIIQYAPNYNNVYIYIKIYTDYYYYYFYYYHKHLG